MLAGAFGTRARIGRRAATVASVVAIATGLLVGAPGRVGAEPATASPSASPATAAPASASPTNTLSAVPVRAGASGLATPSSVAGTLKRRLSDIDLDHIEVRFHSLPANINARLALAGARISRSVAGTSWTELSTPNHGARAARAKLLHDPSIAQVDFSYISHALTLPNDPQWNARQSSYLAPLRLDRAWDLSKGAGVTVAVVDTGTDLDHPDLAGQLVAGRNVLNPGAPPQDDNGHGTLVTGIVAARTNNARGVVGVAPAAKVMPIKVLDSSGSGSDANIAVGIDWARTHHAKVINLSLGGTFDDPVLSNAIANAIAANVVVVAAAGNDGSDTVGFPASYAGVLAVGATDHAGALTSFTSYGPRIDVVAPGLDITSTALGSTEAYATDSGTSFSSPIVAGVAALVRSQHPTWTQSQVDAQIRDTARDVGLPGVDPAFGHGIVDALAAVGGPAAAPHPTLRVGADEPNDTPAQATPLAIGATHSAQIAPETDQDWYRLTFAGPGWYSIRVPASAPSLDHAIAPAVELYHSDRSFAASQELAGGDLLVHISVTGDYFVQVRNGNGSSAPYTIKVSPASTPPRFAPSLDIDFGTPAASVGIADVDGDGRKDALVAFGVDSGFPDTLAVFGQTPTRSLTLLAALPTDPMSGGGMATGDLDGDGHADVAIPVDGGFDIFTDLSQTSLPQLISVPGTTTSLAIADVDGDGHNDVVTNGSGGVRVYWGPAFSPSTSTIVSGSSTAQNVAVGDIAGNGDGLLDIVTCCVAVFQQTSHHVFAVAHSGGVLTGADVAVGDVNGDSLDDVVASVPAFPAGAISRLNNDGSGGISPAVQSTVAARPESVAIADIDGDGKNDIVTLHGFVSPGNVVATVGWLRQSAPGVFGGPEQTFSTDDFSSNFDANALAVGDLDGDGADDALVATGGGISILVQNSGLLPSLGAAWVLDALPQSLATNVVSSVDPTVDLGRDATNVSTTTVQLRNADGNAVAESVGYDSTTHRITISPSSALPNGSYAVQLSGLTDASGEIMPDAESTFFVGPPPDETAPQTTLHSPPSGVKSTATQTLSFSSNQAGSGFSCSNDNAPYRPCTSPQHVTVGAGAHAFRVFAHDAAGNEDSTPALASWTYRVPVHGYWMVGGAGAVYHFGNAPGFGNAATLHAVDFEASPSGYGYWIVDSAGTVFAFGDARAHGNAPALAPGDSVTSLSRTATGNGYWLFTRQGRVYPFGDAHFYGDLRNVRLNGGVVDSVRTPSGHGYYMVATDGGVFSFGDAHFHGSTGNLRLNAPVRSLVPDPDGAGYWLVAGDGGIFAFDAPFRGSMGGAHLNQPIVGMVSFGNGYLMVAADGGIFDFSTKPFLGSLGGRPPSVPIVSVAAVG